jgi:dTDP-glucose pyrophosphorylase
MGGSGRPFEEYSKSFPKTLIEIHGHPLIEYAIHSSKPDEDHRFIFVIRADDAQLYHLDDVLNLLAPGCEMIFSRGMTGGALCTALLAVDKIDPELPLLISNNDQYLKIRIDAALADFRRRDLDVGILTFSAVHPRWSFARLAEDGMVIETAEKRPISNHATCGLYYYRTASSFLSSARKSLLKNNVTNNQFYICPAINELILSGHRVGVFPVPNELFIPLGTPDDVDRFKQSINRSPLDS